MTRLGALVRGGVEGVVGTLAMDLLWYPSGLLIRTRPLPQTGIGGKNDHVVDQLGLTYCRKAALSAFFPPLPHFLVQRPPSPAPSADQPYPG